MYCITGNDRVPITYGEFSEVLKLRVKVNNFNVIAIIKQSHFFYKITFSLILFIRLQKSQLLKIILIKPMIELLVEFV